jgi:hypothetical protein
MQKLFCFDLKPSRGNGVFIAIEAGKLIEFGRMNLSIQTIPGRIERI